MENSKQKQIAPVSASVSLGDGASLPSTSSGLTTQKAMVGELLPPGATSTKPGKPGAVKHNKKIRGPTARRTLRGAGEVAGKEGVGKHRGRVAPEPKPAPNQPPSTPQDGNQQPGKRPRVTGATPPEAVRAAKRPRDCGRSVGSYADAASPRDMKVVITKKADPEAGFTGAELETFREAICVAADKQDGEGKSPLRFHSTKMTGNSIIVTASDKHSRDWILEMAVSAHPLPGHELEAIELSKIVRLQRAMLWIQGKWTAPLPMVFKRLEMQNPGLNTRQWRVYYRKDEPKGLRLVMGVDEASIEVLRGTNFRPYLRLDRAHFSLMDRPRPNSPVSGKPEAGGDAKEPPVPIGEGEGTSPLLRTCGPLTAESPIPPELEEGLLRGEDGAASRETEISGRSTDAPPMETALAPETGEVVPGTIPS